MSCQDDLFRTLRERGMRVTPQREMVLSVMHDIEDHTTVEAIYRQVQLRSAVIDISTVYRTLELLQAMNLLAVVEGCDGQRRFALHHAHDAHAHLVCTSCGTVLEADPEPLEVLARVLQQEYGFALATNRLTLAGRCATCAGDGTSS